VSETSALNEERDTLEKKIVGKSRRCDKHAGLAIHFTRWLKITSPRELRADET
jgi:hypothetical protein